MKLFTHGFISSAKDPETPYTYFVPGEFCPTSEERLQIMVSPPKPAWMKKYQGRHDVLLLDWSGVSFFKPNFEEEEKDASAKSNWMGKIKNMLGKSLSTVSKAWSAFEDKYSNYEKACLNSLDVGNYVGRCLAGLARS